jgi:hypothetical protein
MPIGEWSDKESALSIVQHLLALVSTFFLPSFHLSCLALTFNFLGLPISVLSNLYQSSQSWESMKSTGREALETNGRNRKVIVRKRG